MITSKTQQLVHAKHSWSSATGATRCAKPFFWKPKSNIYQYVIYHWLLLSIVNRLVKSQPMDQDKVIDVHQYFCFCHNPVRNSSLSASSISRDSQLKVLSNCPINFSPTVPTETSSSLTMLAKEVTPAPWNKDTYPIFVFRYCQPGCHRARSDQTRTCQLYNWEPSHGLWPSHCCAPWVQYECFQSDWSYA